MERSTSTPVKGPLNLPAKGWVGGRSWRLVGARGSAARWVRALPPGILRTFQADANVRRTGGGRGPGSAYFAGRQVRPPRRLSPSRTSGRSTSRPTGTARWKRTASAQRRCALATSSVPSASDSRSSSFSWLTSSDTSTPPRQVPVLPGGRRGQEQEAQSHHRPQGGEGARFVAEGQAGDGQEAG